MPRKQPNMHRRERRSSREQERPLAHFQAHHLQGRPNSPSVQPTLLASSLFLLLPQTPVAFLRLHLATSRIAQSQHRQVIQDLLQRPAITDLNQCWPAVARYQMACLNTSGRQVHWMMKTKIIQPHLRLPSERVCLFTLYLLSSYKID